MLGRYSQWVAVNGEGRRDYGEPPSGAAECALVLQHEDTPISSAGGAFQATAGDQ